MKSVDQNQEKLNNAGDNKQEIELSSREVFAKKDNMELSKRYSSLSSEQKNVFSMAQQNAIQKIQEVIQGSVDLPGLNNEERFVIVKIQNLYAEFKKQHPNDEFNFDFSNEIDKQIYNNLIQKIALYDELPEIIYKNNQEKANRIRKSIGISEISNQNEESDLEIMNNFNEIDISNVLKNTTTETLVTALKGASEEVKQKIFKNMSIRAAQILEEEINSSMPTDKQIKEAQRKILNIL